MIEQMIQPLFFASIPIVLLARKWIDKKSILVALPIAMGVVFLAVASLKYNQLSEFGLWVTIPTVIGGILVGVRTLMRCNLGEIK